jgi:hypothetical protein
MSPCSLRCLTLSKSQLAASQVWYGETIRTKNNLQSTLSTAVPLALSTRILSMALLLLHIFVISLCCSLLTGVMVQSIAASPWKARSSSSQGWDHITFPFSWALYIKPTQAKFYALPNNPFFYCLSHWYFFKENIITLKACLFFLLFIEKFVWNESSCVISSRIFFCCWARKKNKSLMLKIQLEKKIQIQLFDF